MRWVRALARVVAVVAALAAADAAAQCGDRAQLDDGWRLATPEQATLDPALICAIGPRLAALPDANPHGVVVVRNGALVYEAYFAGPDARWPQQRWREALSTLPHDARTLHDLQSITKSVVALLAGIALDRGLLRNLDTPVLGLFPDLADLRSAERDRIVVRDLLTMTAGLHWQYKPYLDMARRMDAAADPYRLVLEQPVTAVPGKDFRYNNGTAELAGAVVAKAAGQPLDRFASDALFAPLGIADWEWGRLANGEPGASWGLRLRPRDLAKLGQLVLDRGAWAGRQVVSAGWIEQMTAPRIVRQHNSYGYLWWLEKRAIDGRDIDVVSGYGWGGQGLFIVPALGLVVVTTAGLYDFDGQGGQFRAADTALDMALRAAVGR